MKVGMHKAQANAVAYFKSVSDYIRRQDRRKALIEHALATRVDRLILIEENIVSTEINKCVFEEMPLCFLC